MVIDHLVGTPDPFTGLEIQAALEAQDCIGGQLLIAFGTEDFATVRDRIREAVLGVF
ncbi:MAG: hypothetical protein ACKOS8_08485 [Gemmataceae bacterium]